MKLILHRLDSPICTPKKQHSHNGSWSQYIRPGKQMLGKQIRPNFLRWTSLLYKILQTSLGTCKPTFILSIHHMWGEIVPWGAVFIRQTSDRLQCSCISQLCQYKLHALIQYSGRSKHALANPLKKFPKSPLRRAGSHFWQAPKSTV